jgi:hypothetical protein
LKYTTVHFHHPKGFLPFYLRISLSHFSVSWLIINI